MTKTKQKRLLPAHIFDAIAPNAQLPRTDFSGTVILRYLNLIASNLGGSDFTESDLTGVLLERANLRGADFYQADLTEANLAGARLNGADFKDALLIRANLYRAIAIGATLTCKLSSADLTEAQLMGADLQYATLDNSKLIKTDLRGANLERVTVNHTNLTGADLTGANLFGTDLKPAILTDVVGLATKEEEMTYVQTIIAGFDDPQSPFLLPEEEMELMFVARHFCYQLAHIYPISMIGATNKVPTLAAYNCREQSREDVLNALHRIANGEESIWN